MRAPCSAALRFCVEGGSINPLSPQPLPYSITPQERNFHLFLTTRQGRRERKERLGARSRARWARERAVRMMIGEKRQIPGAGRSRGVSSEISFRLQFPKERYSMMETATEGGSSVDGGRIVRTTWPRHVTPSPGPPPISGGRSKVNSIGVSSGRGSSAANSTPDRLTLMVRPSTQPSSPRGR